MEKTPTPKELKDALDVLGPLTRDKLNAAIGLKQEIASLERVRDALAIAQRLTAENSAANEKAGSEHERLTKEIADLEKTAHTLRADTATAKALWKTAQEDLATARQELAEKREAIAAADAHIARGQEAARLLAGLATH